MSKIILQPCRDALAYKHFEDTVLQKVPLAAIDRFLTVDQRNRLANLYPDGLCNVWGVEPKTKEVNVTKWKRIAPGDIVFFARNKKIYRSGTVTLTIRNRQAAFRLWGDSGGNPPSTWECMYFLKNINQININVEEFNRIKGNKLGANIQGFNVLYEEESLRILQELGIDDVIERDKDLPASRAEIEKSLKELSGTDGTAIVPTRKEQRLLTKGVHGSKTENECAICHKTYPISFLVTAHIKKRINCSDDERTNLDIVMPLCRFGCDELYERGYIGVVAGKVILIKKEPITDAVSQYLDEIEGKDCTYFSENTQGFFAWHQAYHQQRISRHIDSQSAALLNPLS